MSTKKLLVVSALAGVVVGAAALEAAKSACPNFNEGEIVIGEKSIVVAIADTPERQAKGLGGCSEISRDSGMLFPYSPPKPASFWMKDMLIPLDIVWIRDGKVIGIEHGAPPPTPATADAALPIYRSPAPIDHVLEIKGGGSEEYGIAIGSTVRPPN